MFALSCNHWSIQDTFGARNDVGYFDRDILSKPAAERLPHGLSALISVLLFNHDRIMGWQDKEKEKHGAEDPAGIRPD